MASAQRQRRSLRVASLAGLGVGLGVLALYVVGGLLVASWSVGDFLANLDGQTVGEFLLVSGLAVACFAIPVAAYLRFRLVSPLAVLALVVVGWPSYGAATGLLTSQTVFGLALYAVYLVPLYLFLYAVVGSVEYYLDR